MHLDAEGLWEIVAGTETNRQKDRLALSAMLAAILESLGVQLDIKKSAKVNWEIIRSFNVGIDPLAQSRAQGLRREFENLSMKKIDKVSDFTDKFLRIVFELRQLGERIDDKEVVNKLLRSMPPSYDSLILSLEQFGDLDTMSLVEAIGSLKVHEMRLSERDAREEEHALLSLLRANSRRQSKKMGRRPAEEEEDEEEEEEEEGEETKGDGNLSRVMRKNKMDHESHLINQRLDVIIVKNSGILHMNARTRRNQEFVKSR